MLVLTLVGVLIALVQLALFAQLTHRHRIATALLGLIGTHTVIALGTQAVGIFIYPVVLGLHAATILGLLYWIDLPKVAMLRTYVTKPWAWLKHADWYFILLLVLAVSFLALPHYNYSGLISHATEPEQTLVEGYNYTYPYFSDEWYSIALAQQTITDQGFPQTHPLAANTPPARNLEAPFHGLIAQLAVFFRLNLLEHYIILSLIINTLIIGALYLVNRKLGAFPIAALIAAIGALFITTGANLPGLWNLLPITLGVLPLCLSFVFLMSNQRWLYLVASALALVYYPPLIVFVLPILGLQLIYNRRWLTTGASMIGLTIVAAGVVFILSGIGSNLSLTELARETLGTLWYRSYTPNALPQYSLWNIVPGLTLLAALVGIIQVRWHDRWLATGIVIGFGFWLVYYQNDGRFIIEYQRAIVVTALLLTALSSLGWHTLLSWLVSGTKRWRVPQPTLAISMATIVILLLLWPGYTQRDNWQQLTLLELATNKHLPPSAPGCARIFVETSGALFLHHGGY